MKFFHLPSELIAAVIDRCDYLTALNISETGKQMNKIVKAYQFDKLHVDELSFSDRPGYVLHVSTNHGPEELIRDSSLLRAFNITYSLPKPMKKKKKQKKNKKNKKQKKVYCINDKTRDILKLIKSVNAVKFDSFTIDVKFIQMLQEISIYWKKVHASFNKCYYNISKEKVLSLWETFKSVDDRKANFLELIVKLINDDMLMRTMPNIAVHDLFNDSQVKLTKNPGLTDRILEFLMEKKPENFQIGPFIANYSSDGIKQLLNTIVFNRDPAIIYWYLGVVELTHQVYVQLLSDLQVYQTEFSELTSTHNLGFCEIIVRYKKKDSELLGIVRFVLVKPQEIVEEQ